MTDAIIRRDVACACGAFYPDVSGFAADHERPCLYCPACAKPGLWSRFKVWLFGGKGWSK